MLRAVVDIGTNSTLLFVGDERDGALVRVLDRAVITRLGRGVDGTRRLAPDAIEGTLAVLRDYAVALRARGVTAVRVVATSAVRDALNRDAFVGPVSELFGVAVETLSGEAEARAGFRGALAGLALDAGAPVVVFDVGGGSTEVSVGVVGERAPRAVCSLDVGAVRLTERHVRHDPPGPEERRALRDAVDRALVSSGAVPLGRTLVGVAGTVITLAAIHGGVLPYAHERIHGARLARDEVDDLVERLAALPHEARRMVPGLDPRRADVIVAGGVIVQAVMARVGARELVVSDGGVRVGLALE